jgi:hypothetical protein
MIKSLLTSLLKTFLLCSWVLHLAQSGLVLFGLICGVLLNSCKLLQGPGRSCSDRTRRRPVNRPSFRVAPTLQWSFSTGNFRRVPAVILPMQLFSCALLACRYRIYRVHVNFKYNFQHPLFKIRRSSKRPLSSCGTIKKRSFVLFLINDDNFVIKTKTNLLHEFSIYDIHLSEGVVRSSRGV